MHLLHLVRPESTIYCCTEFVFICMELDANSIKNRIFIALFELASLATKTVELPNQMHGIKVLMTNIHTRENIELI